MKNPTYSLITSFVILFISCSNTIDSDKNTESAQNSSQNTPTLSTSPDSQISPNDKDEPQKLAQKPQDRPIKTSSGKCFAPGFESDFDKGSYIGLADCNTIDVLPARFDVFGRISFFIHDTWLCITSPSDISQKQKDYLYLSPCVINSKYQQWQLVRGEFWMHDSQFGIKDDGTYLYVSNAINEQLNQTAIAQEMTSWSLTAAQPANISVVTFLAWDLGKDRYYMRNNASYKDLVSIYYDIEKGHLAQYSQLEGKLYCLYSDTGTQTWQWAHWGLCSDKAPPKDNKAFFKPTLISDNYYTFEDKDGNLLRVTRYGPNWGVPYVANKEFIKGDTTYSPTSEFVLDTWFDDWYRFVMANYGKNLQSCPAPGRGSPAALQASNKEPSFDFSQYDSKLSNIGFLPLQMPKDSIRPDEPRVGANIDKSYKNLTATNALNDPADVKDYKLPILQNPLPALPADFVLNQDWVRRFWEINLTTDNQPDSEGNCGTCMLQAFQMIAELLENPSHPRTSGGYFFDTQTGANPFVSFRSRNSMLAATLADISQYYNQNVSEMAQALDILRNRGIASSISMLPQYNWNVIGASIMDDISSVASAMLNAPLGSVFITTYNIMAPNMEVLGHSVAVLRVQGGAVVLPTNDSALSLEEYTARLDLITNPQQFLLALGRFGNLALPLISLVGIEARRDFYNLFAPVLSFNNCTGDGDHRRGSGAAPSHTSVNQCSRTDRCEF